MGLEWIDGGRKEPSMGKLIRTNKRLYGTDQDGISYLAHPAGAEVPEDEYKRLAKKRERVENKLHAPVENKMRTPAENKAPAKALKRMNKEELLAEAARLGINGEGKTNRELIEAIEAAE